MQSLLVVRVIHLVCMIYYTIFVSMPGLRYTPQLQAKTFFRSVGLTKLMHAFHLYVKIVVRHDGENLGDKVMPTQIQINGPITVDYTEV